MIRIKAHLLILGSILGLLFAVSSTDALEQGPRWSREHQIGQPMFALQTYNRLSDNEELCRVDLVVEVANDMLQFVREGKLFKAAAEVTISIFDSDEEQVHSDLRRLSRTVNSFDQTNSRRDFISDIFSADLLPGKYNVKALLVDKESRRREILDKEFVLELPDRNRGLLLSDLLLSNSSSADQTRRLPLDVSVSGTILDKSSALFCYFDLYRVDPLQVCQLTLHIIEGSGKRIPADSLSLVGGEQLSSYFLKIPTRELGFARYDLILTTISDTISLSRKTKFQVNYYGLPSAIHDLDQAILQLKYIADEDEIKRLLSVFPSDKEESFLKFWKVQFPAPGESVNGKMVEYYQRIDSANDQFGNNKEGWTTDRGQIMVMYGRPSEIERLGGDDGNLYYEVWYYSHLNRRFVFRDEYGFGEFRLVSNLW